jgi:hypothetical protein
VLTKCWSNGKIQGCTPGGKDNIKTCMASDVAAGVKLMLWKMVSYEKMLIYCWKFTKMNYEGSVKLGNQKMAK